VVRREIHFLSAGGRFAEVALVSAEKPSLCGIGDFLAVENSKPLNLLRDIANVNRHRSTRRDRRYSRRALASHPGKSPPVAYRAKPGAVRPRRSSVASRTYYSPPGLRSATNKAVSLQHGAELDTLHRVESQTPGHSPHRWRDDKCWVGDLQRTRQAKSGHFLLRTAGFWRYLRRLHGVCHAEELLYGYRSDFTRKRRHIQFTWQRHGTTP